ncbi:hypothetical protein GMO_02110 [Gluconobacter morbifer G707]|uniref:Uncharacterized protein n=1 Tax=Gluconobacter morbifer G707 TaxID=1088869 RepID=G6XFE6_9PROT|nr:hypothetical protein GMO_02110 [Gluconobacter morbifer G707]
MDQEGLCKKPDLATVPQQTSANGIQRPSRPAFTTPAPAGSPGTDDPPGTLAIRPGKLGHCTMLPALSHDRRPK